MDRHLRAESPVKLSSWGICLLTVLTFCFGSAPNEKASAANLAITSVSLVDQDNTPFVPAAGEGFWVRVDYTYQDPVCTAYTIGREVNGQELHRAPEVDWGCGLRGTTHWIHIWGAWSMFRGGVYSVTVTLDVDDKIHETNETDNSMTINFTVTGDVDPRFSLVNVAAGLAALGDGTDVVVGTMDDALEINHPWLSGEDSLGRPRLIASNQNTDGVGSSPVNAGHATTVMGIVLSRGFNDGDVTGLAPDARYVTAEFLNRASVPGLSVLHVVDAAGFLADNDVEIINMSWSWWFGSGTDSRRGEGSVTNLMADYLSYGRNILCVASVNQLESETQPTAPGAARNVITVGALTRNSNRAWSEQDHGPTLDGRSKPDILGNREGPALLLNTHWRSGFSSFLGVAATSQTTPFVTGVAAQMIDYAKHHGGSLDHRILKAVIMNSGAKVFDSDGTPWSNSSTQPLDDEQGTGLLDIERVAEMFTAGEQDSSEVAVPGYDFGEVSGVVSAGTASGRKIYHLGKLSSSGVTLDVTLAWDRHTFWDDANANNLIDAADTFFASNSDRQDNLDVVVYRNGVEIAASRSMLDTVEHIHLTGLGPGSYEIYVERLDVPSSGVGEEYGLAWHAGGVWDHTTEANPIWLDYD